MFFDEQVSDFDSMMMDVLPLEWGWTVVDGTISLFPPDSDRRVAVIEDGEVAVTDTIYFPIARAVRDALKG